MNYTVYLQQGKGTVQAEVWTYRVGKSDTRDAVASTSTPGGYATASLNNGDTKYWKFRVPDEGQNPGYTFDGWYSDEKCTKGKNTNNPYGSRDLTASRNKTVYAKFVPNKYTLTFDKNAADASLGTTSSTVTFDAHYDAGTGGWPTPTRTGYTFDGWFTSGGTQIYESTTVTTASNHTLYAHWTAKTYSITLDNESPTTSGSTSVTLTYDSKDHAAITNPKKTNFTFEGWWTGDNGLGSLVIAANGTMQANVDGYTGANGIWKKDGTATLYACWAAYITLDNQSATSAGTTSVRVVSNTNANLTGSITKPTKTGYKFYGYYTGVNGNGIQLIDRDGNFVAKAGGNSTYTDESKNWKYSGGITLYAYWANDYYGRAVAYPSPVGNGKVWVSCNNNKPANAGSYFAEKDSSNWTIVAQTSPTCRADYFALANTGYSFKGWFTAKNGTGEKKSDNLNYSENFTVTSTNSSSRTIITRYAYFTPNTYVVSFNANSGSCGTENTTVTYASTYGAGTNGWPTPTRTGYTFAGWFTDVAEGAQIYASTVVEITEAQTLYAHWTPNDYTITLVKHNGNSDEAISVTYDSNKNLTSGVAVPTRTGYTFGGYYTEVNGGGTQRINASGAWIPASGFIVDGKWNSAGSVTLHAKWTPIDYTITLNNQEATTAGTTTIDVTFGSSDNLTSAIEKPTKANCTFEGYFTGTSGTGVEIINKEGNVIANAGGGTYTDADRKWKYANDIILYAYWKKNQTITWNLVDGVGVNYATGQEMGATASSGYAVAYRSSNDAVAIIVDGKLQVLQANQTVTITASQAGDLIWNAAPEVSKTFQTSGSRPDNFTAVEATDLTYGQTLAESTLSGTVKLGDDVIAGTLSWVDSTTVPNAGNAGMYTARFTPTNQAVYSIVTFDVNVKVAKAEPEFTRNIGESLRASSRYSNFVISSNTEVGFTVTTSNVLLTAESTGSGAVLRTGSMAKTAPPATGLTITISQAESTNFLPHSETWTVEVLPRTNVCLPLDPITQSEFNEAIVGSESSVTWCSTNSEGNGQYIYSKLAKAYWYTVYYTQQTGIALGTWLDGLNGFNFENFSYSTKSVVISFNGIPEQISFEVYSQHLRSVGNLTGATGNYDATLRNWILEQSADGVNFSQVGDGFTSPKGGTTGTFVQRNLNEDTRHVRITYTGNFTGFIHDLRISQKKYLNVDKTSLIFGDADERPLQVPQEITLDYSSLGLCEDDDPHISISSNNAAFYVDEPKVTENVGINDKGTRVVRVRCTDVDKSGTLTIASSDGSWTKTVALTSANPKLTSAGTNVFQTGTEHSSAGNDAYRTLRTHDFSAYFKDDKTARYDTLYIYGVSASNASNRQWSVEVGKKVPVVTTSNVHTPCFVYMKNKDNNKQYIHKRTFDAATTTLNVSSDDKLAFMGYKPADLTNPIPAIQITGDVSIYLHNTEMLAKEEVLALSGTATIYANGTNSLTSDNNAAVQLNGLTTLKIEGTKTDVIALRPKAGKPSFEINDVNDSVIVNGAQLELHNGAKMAVEKDGGTNSKAGIVRINDGTITGETTLYLPWYTEINGGTFNSGTVKVINWNGHFVRPTNKKKQFLARIKKTTEELKAETWYGQKHLVDETGIVYPMLEDPSLCKFTDATKNKLSSTDGNWTNVPNSEADAIIQENMKVDENLAVNSITIDESKTVFVQNGAMLTIGDEDSFREIAGNLQVENGGKVVLGTGELVVDDFIIKAERGGYNSDGSSAQIVNSNALLVQHETYFDLALDPSGECSRGWYDFSVPFQVDAVNGVTRFTNDTKQEINLVIEDNYAIMNFSENRHVTTGYGWKKFHGVLLPGQIYAITIDDVDNVYRFKKIKDPVRAAESEYLDYTDDESNPNRGWNGLGNGSFEQVRPTVSGTAVEYVQVYDHGKNKYNAIPLAGFECPTGSAYFVQAGNATSTVIYQKSANLHQAPQKDRNTSNQKFTIALSREDSKDVADRLYVGASEDAIAEYEIGRDLMKFGNPLSAKDAQLWANTYGLKLCAIDMPLVYSEANCDLRIFAPKDGSYSLEIENGPEDAELYLTYNGKVVWNLSSSPCSLGLNKGTKEGFGLRIKYKNGSQIAEGVDDITSDSQTLRKVLIDNTIYVITPEGAMYDLTGKLVH